MDRERRLSVFFWTAGTLGAVVAPAYVRSVPFERWPEIVLVGTLLTGLMLFVVKLPTGVRIAAAFPVLAATIVNLGPGTAILVALPAIAARVAILGDSPLYGFYNIGQVALSCVAAGHAYLATGGRTGYTAFPAGFLSLVALGMTYDLVNVGFAQGRATLQFGGRWLERWVHSLVRERGYAVAIYHVMGLVTTVLYQDRGPLGLALACVLLVGLQLFFRLYAEVSATKLLAMTDRLTQVYNYRYLTDWLQREFARATEGSRPFSALWVDVDNLKRVNDTHGHEAGNAVLRTVAEVLKANTRQSDAVVRYGGDEFVVLLPGSGRADSEQVVRRITEAMASQPAEHEGAVLRVGLSIGTACYPDDAESPQELLTASDRAMYQAKQLKGVVSAG